MISDLFMGDHEWNFVFYVTLIKEGILSKVEVMEVNFGGKEF